MSKTIDEDFDPVCPSCKRIDCELVGKKYDKGLEFLYEGWRCRFCKSEFDRKYCFSETVPVKLVAPKLERLNILGTVYVEKEVAQLLYPSIRWDFLEKFMYWMTDGTRLLPENWLNAVLDGSYVEISKYYKSSSEVKFCSVCGKMLTNSVAYDSITCLPLCDKHSKCDEFGIGMNIFGDTDFFKTKNTFLVSSMQDHKVSRWDDGRLQFFGSFEDAMQGLVESDYRADTVSDCVPSIQEEFMRLILEINMKGDL